MTDFFTLQYKDNHVIRTFEHEDILFTCLTDVLMALGEEEKKLNGNKPALSMATRLKNQTKFLKPKEHKNFILPHPQTGIEQSEICVTEPGLYRLLSRDDSAAGIQFQDWLFYDVLPSLRKYKQYPAPENTTVTTPDFSTMDVSETSMHMIAHIATGLGNAIKDINEIKAQHKKIQEDTHNLRNDTEEFKGKTNLRLESLETTEQLTGLMCMDEFLSLNPDIKMPRDNFLGACDNLKLSHKGQHIIITNDDRTKSHYFDIVTLNAAKSL